MINNFEKFIQFCSGKSDETRSKDESEHLMEMMQSLKEHYVNIISGLQKHVEVKQESDKIYNEKIKYFHSLDDFSIPLPQTFDDDLNLLETQLKEIDDSVKYSKK